MEHLIEWAKKRWAKNKSDFPADSVDWAVEVPRDAFVYVKVGEGSSLTLKAAILKEKKKGNIARVHIDRKPNVSGLPSEECLCTLDADGISLAFFHEVLVEDFALEQLGIHGPVILYGKKSKVEDQFEIDLIRRSFDAPLKSRFEFIKAEDYVSSYKNTFENLHVDVQEKIKKDNLQRLEDFLCQELQKKENEQKGRSRDALEYYAYHLRNFIKEDWVAGMLKPADKKKIEDAVDAAVQWLNNNQLAEAEEYDDKMKELESLWNPIKPTIKVVTNEDGSLMGGSTSA